jgi:hypothetical protein
MKLPKPKWHLARFLIPAILASLFLLFCFPFYLLCLIISAGLLIIGLNFIRLLPSTKATAAIQSAPGPLHAVPNIVKEPYSLPLPSPIPACAGTVPAFARTSLGRGVGGEGKYFFTIFNSIFLSGISLVFFIFLTAANHLSPDALAFESLKKFWEIIFPLGVGLLMAQLAVLSQKPIPKGASFLSITREKTLLCIELFFNFSGFGALAIGLGIVIFTISNALLRLIGFSISNELQLQTIIASTLIGLPFLTKRWKKRRYVDFSISRRQQLFRLSLIMIFFIIVLGILTIPFASDPIGLTVIQPTLALTQWKLFVLGWWIAIISLLGRQIIERSQEKSPSKIFTTLFITSGCIYILGIFLLTAGGKDYFLTVLKQGVPALILTSVPIAVFVLNLANFQGTVKFTGENMRKQKRNAKYISHTLIQTTALACGLYWTTGLSLLSPLLLMVTVPSILLFLLV